MAYWGLIPELADRGAELQLIANPGEWNMSLDRWQWDYCGIWVAGPLPRPGKGITLTTHSRYGMLHPFCARRENTQSRLQVCFLHRGVRRSMSR